jgi:poly(3-hydroxybutyrate) depolymerase
VKQEIMSMGGMIVAPTSTTMKGDDVTFVLGVWYSPGDFEWADNVAACAIQNYNIDPRRIYATGCSAGGLATGVMTFARSNYLAASAPNSGGIAPIPGIDKLQNPKRVTPTMTMHGAPGSDVVIVDFSETSASLATSAKAHGGFVIDCNHGGGHCGSPAELQVAAWQFMKDHPFGVSPEPYASGLPASFPKYCKVQ